MRVEIFKTHKARIIYIIIGIIIFGVLYALKNASYSLWITSFLFSILLFYAADLWFNLDFKKRHYAIFIIVAFAGIILSSLYFVSPNYDKWLHLINPIFLSTLTFYLLDKVKIKFSTKIFLTFAIMVAALSIFEIGEYLLDKIFDLKLQGVYLRSITEVAKLDIILDKNDDTMIDLILGSFGALIFILARTIIFYQRKWNNKLRGYF
jgi:hypothetical protein